MRLTILAAVGAALIGPAGAASLELAGGAPPQASPCPPGFAALQNSETCVRIGGQVRAEGTFGSPRTRGSDAIGTRAGGRVQLEIRKQTEYGPLRAVIRGETVR